MKLRLLALLPALLLWLAAPPALAADIVDPYGAYTYDEMVADIAALQTSYPELVSVFSVGDSVEGRDIPGFYLGKGERRAVICAATHAREYVTAAFVMDMAEGYCRGYMADGGYQGMSYRQALDNITLIIVPMLNPDGVTLAQQGLDGLSLPRRAAVSAMPILEHEDKGYAAWKSNINGVDLNRNFPWKWGLKIKAEQPASMEYIGPFAASEPETQAMLSLLEAVDHYMLVSLHSMGEVIYWLDTDTLDLYDSHKAVADRFARAFGYELMPVEDTARSGGFMVNGERYKTRLFCMTVEMGDKVYEPDIDEIISDCYGLGLLMAKEIMALPPRHISVAVEGAPVCFPDQQPLLRDGHIMVPLRPVLEAIGAEISWDGERKAVVVEHQGNKVQLWPGNLLMTVNERKTWLEQAPLVVNSRIMLPLRAMMEALGYTVEWDGAAKTAFVSAA